MGIQVVGNMRIFAIFVLSALIMGAAPPPKQEAPSLPVQVKQIIGAVKDGAKSGAVMARLKKLRPKKAVGPLVVAQLADRDERVRAMAAFAIGQLRVREARNKLAVAMGDPSPAVVVAAARALAALGGKGADTEVQELMAHRSVSVRCAGAELIRKQRGHKKLAALQARLKVAETAEERACLVTALYKAGHKPALQAALPMLAGSDTRALGEAILILGADEGLEVLRSHLAKPKPTDELIAAAMSVAQAQKSDGLNWAARLVAHKDARVRRASLELLLAHIGTPVARQLLMSAASSADPVTRARVIDSLREKKDTALAAPARKWLSDDSPLVRAAAARVLADMASKNDSELVLRAYQNERMVASDKNVDVRIALLHTLGAIGNPDWIPVFVDATGQSGEEQAATDALVATGKSAVRTLLLVVKVGDMERIPYALEALARIGHGVGAAAEGLFRHPRELVRELGRDLMAASGDPTAVGALVKLYKSETLQDPVPVIEAIATFASPEAIDALRDASTHPSGAVRLAAVRGLGELHRRDGPSVAALVKAAETDSSPEVRGAAVRALFRVGYQKLVPLLKKLVTYETSHVRSQCYEALGWSGDFTAVPLLSARLREAEGDEKRALDAALYRLTRREDLKSERNYRTWTEQTQALVTPKAKGTPGKVKSGKVELTYRTVGAGHTIIALGGHHGGTVWAPSLDRLASTHRVVALDGRGRGATPLSGELSLGTEVTDIELLRRHIKADKVSLVAHGPSGLVAMAYAKTYPKRVHKLVLISTPARGLRYGTVASATRMLKGKASGVLSDLDAQHAWFSPTAWLYYRQFALAPGYVNDLSSAALLGAFPSDPVARQALETAVANYDAGKVLDTVAAPTTFLLGERAPYTSSQRAALRKLAKRHRHVTVREVKDAGHYPHIEKPASTAATIRGLIGGAR